MPFYAFAILVQVPVHIFISDCSVAGDSVGIKDRRWDALLLLLLLLLLVVVGVKTLAEVSDVRAPVARQGRAEHFANNEQ